MSDYFLRYRKYRRFLNIAKVTLAVILMCLKVIKEFLDLI
jgi:hypothetical protein